MKCHNNKNYEVAPQFWRFAALLDAMTYKADLNTTTLPTTARPATTDAFAKHSTIEKSLESPCTSASGLEAISATNEVVFDKDYDTLTESRDPSPCWSGLDYNWESTSPEDHPSKRRRTGFTSFAKLRCDENSG